MKSRRGWPRRKVPKWHHSQLGNISLSLSLTLIAFVRAMPTQQSKCDVQYQPDSEVVQRPLKTDQASLGSCA